MKRTKLIFFGLLALIGLDVNAQEMVKDIRTGVSSGISLSASLVNVNGTLFFMANNGTNGEELWKSDGTVAGTAMVKDIKPGASGSTGGLSPSLLINVNGTLYFVADDGTNGAELWKSDGTVSGTVMVKDIVFGSGSGILSSFAPANVNGTLYFAASDGTNGNEIWKSDGTTTGTVIVKDIKPGANGSNPGGFANVNGTLFFKADDGTNGTELWKSDGTIAGTVMMKDIQPGTIGSETAGLFNINGTLYFWADDGTNGMELWKSDGTAPGTIMVNDILTGSGSSHPSFLSEFNGKLFFSADDGTNGTELWTSDGTTGGTVMVKDIKSGSGGSGPFNFFSFNNTLYFGADDGTAGVEFWKSDGTTDGTVMVKDIYTGAGNSNPSRFIEVNGTLYFTAANYYGRELWKYTPLTGILETTVHLPENFTLSQNFPNPFNPSTTLSFAISHSSLVSLKVFDVLGREVAAPVNEYKLAGNYDVNFDASRLSSGVYFYQLRAGNNVETKSMILLK
ncbi:MAG: T9SS type A sorting domain-containing protein [Ignavibacteriaceae bacterium]|nr:T9SS type A sorting domain-containing protein [Ignavibacteriaceae bacterium]